ncbi:MAG TPA: SRPBCC domain-containing protein [Flavisolibacter sp.]|jgi:uncharacterized protein YndB with AHSA1/START domain
MTTLKETIYSKDEANKKLFAEREFDAPVKDVWRAWTEPQLLDQWWAPRPWKAVTLSMDFKDGGTWLYYMEGPDGTRHYCRADYSSIVPNKSYKGLDCFCDEKGNINTELPRMNWQVSFNESSLGTKVRVELTFDSLEALHKIVEMGFKEGFAMAHNNLDELLAKGLQ